MVIVQECWVSARLRIIQPARHDIGGSLAAASYRSKRKQPRLMRTFCLHLTIIIAVIAFASCATAQDTPPVTAAPPQYFTLNLPAGVSLISAPLNTGQALARDEFLGLPP